MVLAKALKSFRVANYLSIEKSSVLLIRKMSNENEKPVSESTETEKCVNPNEDSDQLQSTAKKQKTDDVKEAEVENKKESDKNEKTESEKTKVSNKKRKYALLLGYSGEGYYGLQRYIYYRNVLNNSKDELRVE
jgi:hypothetical protein